MTARKDDIITLLERFGLATYEAKAYRAAIGQPPLTAYKLAQLSGVPRPRIYEIVDSLAANGLLIFQSGGRTLLTAASCEKILSRSFYRPPEGSSGTKGPGSAGHHGLSPRRACRGKAGWDRDFFKPSQANRWPGTCRCSRNDISGIA